MKFKTNDILENRSGTKILITNSDQSAAEYHYKYLYSSNPQFQGSFCHSADDIERYWSCAGKNLSLSAGMSPQDFIGYPTLVADAKNCDHEIATYVGFTNTYQYCKKCDDKF